MQVLNQPAADFDLTWFYPCSTGSEKSPIQELDGLNFMEDSAGALTNLLASAPAEIKCVESIVFSSFNPPPSYRR
jgi:protein TIF31